MAARHCKGRGHRLWRAAALMEIGRRFFGTLIVFLPSESSPAWKLQWEVIQEFSWAGGSCASYALVHGRQGGNLFLAGTSQIVPHSPQVPLWSCSPARSAALSVPCPVPNSHWSQVSFQNRSMRLLSHFNTGNLTFCILVSNLNFLTFLQERKSVYKIQAGDFFSFGLYINAYSDCYSFIPISTQRGFKQTLVDSKVTKTFLADGSCWLATKRAQFSPTECPQWKPDFQKSSAPDMLSSENLTALLGAKLLWKSSAKDQFSQSSCRFEA